ncbi:MAG: ATP-binding protein [Synergistaceae bacterium]|nr:ATP-binding protein [Synergistaceae bacterium]
MFFRNLPASSTLAKLKKTVRLSPPARHEMVALMKEVASDIVDEAEALSLEGDLWETFLALRLAQDDNALGRAAELNSVPTGSVVTVALSELWSLQKIVTTARTMVDNAAELDGLRILKTYALSSHEKRAPLAPALKSVSRLAAAFRDAQSPDEMMSALLGFYTSRGSGIFSLYRAFIWSPGKGLQPVKDPDPQKLSSLLGYGDQKDELLANTKLFLGGQAANNVLLYGDSGTGKSSSVKALLNEPDFIAAGLRMIEVNKEQISEIPSIMRLVGERNYRFILFLDDLSFEDYEVEYKHLKALIEGGIERKPDNVVIYATSNRRNIVREVWKDRRASNDDVHGWDTMQEKLSLSDRFGITIWYSSLDKEKYMEIVRFYVAEYGIEIQEDELERLAMRWEIGRGGFSGRTARQFAQHLLIGRKN